MKKKRTMEHIIERYERGCITAYKNGSQSKKWVKAVIGYVPE